MPQERFERKKNRIVFLNWVSGYYGYCSIMVVMQPSRIKAG